MVKSRTLLGVAAILAVALALAVIYIPGARSAMRHLLKAGATPQARVGDQLPAVRVADLAGNLTALAPKSGRMLFINVFATWCVPCKSETPDLVRFRPIARARGIDIVGIDRYESADAVRAFSKRFGVDYPVYIDDSHVSDYALGVRFIPTSFLIGPDGKIVARHDGPLTLDQMEAMSAAASTGS